MSENIQSIANGTYTIGETNKLTFSAGPGIKIDEPSAGTVRIGTDETVLYSATSAEFSNTSYSLSESPMNFEYAKITWHDGSPSAPAQNILQAVDEIDMSNLIKNYASFSHTFLPSPDTPSGGWEMYAGISGLSSTNWKRFFQGSRQIQNYSWSWTNSAHMFVVKIVGINRISGSNT